MHGLGAEIRFNDEHFVGLRAGADEVGAEGEGFIQTGEEEDFDTIFGVAHGAGVGMGGLEGVEEGGVEGAALDLDDDGLIGLLGDGGGGGVFGGGPVGGNGEGGLEELGGEGSSSTVGPLISAGRKEVVMALSQGSMASK